MQVLEMAGLFSIQEYVSRQKNTMKYILTRPIYQKCLASKPLARNVNQSVWWYLLLEAAVFSNTTGIQQQQQQLEYAL
jgi:hypothetical protein